MGPQFTSNLLGELLRVMTKSGFQQSLDIESPYRYK